ncbi:anion permease [Planococcus sp. ISL-109]|uniref:SLC13 family permease n=1 Tax=Planococcus sp. ISL-109 TaxID=2819166 RepID=UPI00333A77D3
MSKVLVKAQADQVFVGILLKLSKGKVQRLLIGLPLLIVFLPILLPSAVARFRILEPIIEQVNDRFELGDRSVFRQFSLYVIGMMNQNSTMIVFTGGGFPILAAQLFRDFGGVQISWLGWFLRIAPPLWIALVIISFGVWFFFKRQNGEIRRMEQMEFTPSARLPERFWWVIVPFIAMIISWIVVDQEQISLIVAPFLLLAYYALPVNGLVDDRLVREYDWETFLLLEASFSLGYLYRSKRNGRCLDKPIDPPSDARDGGCWEYHFCRAAHFRIEIPVRYPLDCHDRHFSDYHELRWTAWFVGVGDGVSANHDCWRCHHFADSFTNDVFGVSKRSPFPE